MVYGIYLRGCENSEPQTLFLASDYYFRFMGMDIMNIFNKI